MENFLYKFRISFKKLSSKLDFSEETRMKIVEQMFDY